MCDNHVICCESCVAVIVNQLEFLTLKPLKERINL